MVTIMFNAIINNKNKKKKKEKRKPKVKIIAEKKVMIKLKTISLLKNIHYFGNKLHQTPKIPSTI